METLPREPGRQHQERVVFFQPEDPCGRTETHLTSPPREPEMTLLYQGPQESVLAGTLHLESSTPSSPDSPPATCVPEVRLHRHSEQFTLTDPPPWQIRRSWPCDLCPLGCTHVPEQGHARPSPHLLAHLS